MFVVMVMVVTMVFCVVSAHGFFYPLGGLACQAIG